jgi:hypothetical protein
MQGYTITPYAGASRFELWAESLTAYFLCPDLLEQKDPTMFSLLSMVISPRLISKGLPAGVTMSRQLYQAKAFETALGEGQQVWLQVYNDGPDDFDNFRVYVNPGQGMLDKAVEIAKGVLGRSDAPHASFKYLSSESLIREQHKGATKLVFYCKTAEDAVRIVQIFRSHPSYGDIGSSGILTDTLPIDNVMMLSGGTRENTDARKPQTIEKLAVLVGAFNEAGIPLADGRFNDGKTRIPANPDELGRMVGQPAITTPVATGASDATTEMSAAKETSDTRTTVTVGALNACEGRGNDVKVVVGVPIGMNKANVQSTISTVNRGLATNGFGRIEDNRQVRIFEIDPADAEKTWQNQEKAMQKAREGLAPEGRIILFAPQMEKGPQLAGKTQEQYKGQGNISVVPDAYSDASPEQDIYPDIMLRVALGRNIAFYYTGHDPQGTLARINDLLAKVINGFMPIVSIDDLLSILKPLRIRPIDFKTITEWQKAQEAVATSA